MITEAPQKTAAEQLFGNQGLHPNANFIASLHPRAIEYLEQAPVLALSFGVKAATRADRLYVAMRIGRPIERGERLRTVMAAANISAPFRKLHAGILAPSHQSIIRDLSIAGPSSLSQMIPQAPGQQQNWLRCIGAWRSRLHLRGVSQKTHLEWCARQIALAQPDRSEVGDAADFVYSHPAISVENWGWDRLMLETNLWHDRLATEKSFVGQSGLVTIDTIIDYSDWPSHTEIDGLEFFKLTTPSMLMEEGRRQRHCVASYIKDVIDGKCNIFSIRDGMRRVATMQLTGKRIVQIKGFANKAVSKSIFSSAEKLIESAA